MNEHREPMVLVSKILEMTLCIPKTWDDAQVEKYAHDRNPLVSWKVGERQRVQCGVHSGAYHITLDCI